MGPAWNDTGQWWVQGQETGGRRWSESRTSIPEGGGSPEEQTLWIAGESWGPLSIL